MSKATKVLWVGLCGVLLAAWTAPLRADAVTEKRKAQNKLLAMRAARVDAMRKLAEQINGLMITSETTVKDFVATDDRIRTSMLSYLAGMKEVGEPKFLPDDTCEVTLEITLDEIIVTLKRFHKEFYRGDKIKVADFDQMTATNKEKTIRATGNGAPRPEFEDRGQEGQGGDDATTIMSQEAWAYWNAHCTGRGRLMAKRAAEVDALRRLAERIQGLMISSETSVKDFVAESDEIRTRMQTFIRGAREVGVRYHTNELIVEVDKEVTLESIIANLKKWHQEFYKGDRVRVQDIEQISVRTEEKTVRETGMGVPPEQYLKDLDKFGAVAVEFANKSLDWPVTLRAKGMGAVDAEGRTPGQAKLMAYRAAELDARRKLAEQIDGLIIRSETSVRDFVAENDEIRTSMMTFQQGARRVPGSEKDLPDGTVEVSVEIELTPLKNMILFYQQKTVRN